MRGTPAHDQGQHHGHAIPSRKEDPKYLGDPINIVRIFNDKEVDEIVLLDIMATPENRGLQFVVLKNIASEAFIPLAYGGGIHTMNDVRTLLSMELRS